MKGSKFHICLITVLANILLVSSSCDFECHDKDGKHVINLQCVNDVQFNKGQWSCLEKTITGYDEYGYYRRHKVVIDDNYELFVKASLSLSNYDDSNFDRLSEQKDHVAELIISKAPFYLIPEVIYEFTSVRGISLQDFNTLTVDLNRFVNLQKLNELFLKNNMIHKLDNSYDVGTKMSPITILDLSMNYLEEIPNNCFIHFPQLKTLILSNNRIKALNILTFEGISQLVALDFSYNQLISLENAFARFINLKELYLENNLIQKLVDFNFVSLTNLEKLNLSSNQIDTIENNTFKSLSKLNFLNINHNFITKINKKMFENNNKLSSLSISHNNIEYIENLAFDNKNITYFEFENISLKGSIQKFTFKGVYTDEINLSGGKIDNLQDEAFGYMCDRLNLINVSHNEISTISYNTFNCLEYLTSLDLSHNRLKVINFNMNSLKNLTSLYLTNNSIENIRQSTFKNLTSLNKLDLSHNSVEKIEAKSFIDLSNLQYLVLSNNLIVSFENDTFDGLVSLRSIDLTHTRLTTLSNKTFNELTSLTSINSSHAQLSMIEYNSFINTGTIEVLDLSHNIIQTFHVNTSTIDSVKRLYLNNNDLKYINNKSFSGLTALHYLTVANNGILNIEPNAFASLSNLKLLYLSSNPEMVVTGNFLNAFSSLDELSMEKVRTSFKFEKWNVQIATLQLQSCGIHDINKLFINDINKLENLNLSMNEISSVDKNSFKNMPNLVILDLSINYISYIQPGSFLNAKKIAVLNLSQNFIQTLQYGIFDGLYLKSLNLSNNAIKNIDSKVFPNVESLYLDNNGINYINFEDFFATEISKLSVGGNKISCKVLVELRNHSSRSVITTQHTNYHLENVDGITCESSSNDTQLILPVTNGTSYDVKTIFSKLLMSIDQLRKSIENDKIENNKSTDDSAKINSKMLKELTSAFNKSQAAYIESLNKTQMSIQQFIIKTEHFNNVSRQNLKEYITNVTQINRLSQNNSNTFNEIKSLDDKVQSEFGEEMKHLMKIEIDTLREEFKDSINNVRQTEPLTEKLAEGQHTDSIFYFMSACLAVIVVLYSINIYFNYTKKQRNNFSNFQNSANPLQMNDLE